VFLCGLVTWWQEKRAKKTQGHKDFTKKSNGKKQHRKSGVPKLGDCKRGGSYQQLEMKFQ